MVRETHPDSGLADAAAQDWPKIIQEFLETDKKVAFAVVMLGANDRKPIREGEVSHPPLSEPWKQIYGQRIESVLRVFQERRQTRPVYAKWAGEIGASVTRPRFRSAAARACTESAVHWWLRPSTFS